jgi:GTP-binding protein
MVQNNWMSDHWENVTDNGSIIDMVIENVPAPKVSEGTPQMLIIFRFLSIYRSYRYWSFERGVLKEGMPISLVKEMVLYQNLVLKNYTFEGLGRKKSKEVIAGDICAIIGVEGFEIGDTIADYENPEGLNQLLLMSLQ